MNFLFIGEQVPSLFFCRPCRTLAVCRVSSVGDPSRSSHCVHAPAQAALLPALVALLLSGVRKSVQAELDAFFVHLRQQAQCCTKSRRKRSRRRAPSCPLLPSRYSTIGFIERAQHYGFVSRWHGLRRVAADASTVRFGLRASHVLRAALPDPIAFGLFLPGCELMLAASQHSVHENERQMLFEHLDRLCSSDLLLLDRGYPSRWLVAVLNQRAIPFCMRADKSGNSGFTCVRDFLRSGLAEQIVTLRAAFRRVVRRLLQAAPNARPSPPARSWPCVVLRSGSLRGTRLSGAMWPSHSAAVCALLHTMGR